MNRPKIKQVLIVEGRDDTCAVNRAVDAMTIETHGFGMSDEMWQRIDRAYRTSGIIILTDPDRAGENIRKKILERYPDAGQAFLPRDKALKKSNVGVENAKPEDIAEAIEKALKNMESQKYAEAADTFTTEDMDRFGLSGGPGASERRARLGDALGIGYGNGKTFLKRLNAFGITREEFEEKAGEL
ncbi:MAG TPA: ribonuclease M5 [Candidatus Avanaerovorax faecigallinarum]|nr:ribonuclease M5 [Candidatus Avanaerovorax faecigallinarum]